MKNRSAKKGEIVIGLEFLLAWKESYIPRDEMPSFGLRKRSGGESGGGGRKCKE